MPRHPVAKCFFLIISFAFLPPLSLAQSGFVGSDKCMSCHEKIYETWKMSSHYKAVQRISPSNDIIIADWKGEAKIKGLSMYGDIPEVTIKFNKGPEGSYMVTLVDAKDSSKEKTYTVSRAQGDGWIKGQQYHVKIGKTYFVLPFVWEPLSQKYNTGFVARPDWWYNEDGSLNQQPSMENSWAVLCSGCHHTGMGIVENEEGYEVTYSELSIGCEQCHGPGAGHVESPEEKEKIINPRNLDYARGMDVCNQCHSVGAGKSVPAGKFKFPWDETNNKPYVIGEPLINYFRPVGVAPVQDNGEPLVLNTYHSLSKSKHHEAHTTCFDCHDPHGGPGYAQLLRADFNNNVCLYCHGEEKEFSSPEKIMQHTKHSYAPGLSGASRCTGCHAISSRRSQKMPSEPPRPRSSSFLGVVKPQESLESFKSDPEKVSINSCNRCHMEWSGDEAGYIKGVQAYETRFGE